MVFKSTEVAQKHSVVGATALKGWPSRGYFRLHDACLDGVRMHTFDSSCMTTLVDTR